jgi:plasmid stabilization system protein ParE
MLPVVFTPAARLEVTRAVIWYDRRQAGLGDGLLYEIDAVVSRIMANPVQFPLVGNNIRRAALKRFPYGLFFRVLPNKIQVLALFHTSRDPEKLRRRIQ